MNKNLLIYICNYLLIFTDINKLHKFLLISKFFNESMMFNFKKRIKYYYKESINNNNLISSYYGHFSECYFIKLSCCEPFGSFNEYGYYSIIRNINEIDKNVIEMRNKIKNIFSPIITIALINLKFKTMNIIYFKRNFIPPKNKFTYNNNKFKFTYLWYYQVKKYKNEVPSLNI
jgi:hypothetical protein